jgi:hypothetical protein
MFSMYGAGGKSGVWIKRHLFIKDTVTRKKLSVYAVALNPTTDPPAVVVVHAASSAECEGLGVHRDRRHDSGAYGC